VQKGGNAGALKGSQQESSKQESRQETVKREAGVEKESVLPDGEAPTVKTERGAKRAATGNSRKETADRREQTGGASDGVKRRKTQGGASNGGGVGTGENHEGHPEEDAVKPEPEPELDPNCLLFPVVEHSIEAGSKSNEIITALQSAAIKLKRTGDSLKESKDKRHLYLMAGVLFLDKALTQV
jgi:hypothetical protein